MNEAKKEQLRQLKFVSIYKKLISFVTWILVLTMGSLFILSALISLNDLNQNLVRIEKNSRDKFEEKGKILSVTHGFSFKQLVEDNAFNAIKEILETTVAQDKDIDYGMFMDANRKQWANSRDGIVADSPVLNDEWSLWAHNVNEITFKYNMSKQPNVIEFAIPIIVENARVGTLRYGITTESMYREIEAAKDQAFRSVLLNLVILIAIGIIIFYVGSRYARHKADTITRPINELSEAADAISKGDYTRAVDIPSNDEIGLLAISFETMRDTVREYTENLEQKVAERTRQLQSAQKELVEQAHKSGMADIATAVLHNIGNILNSAMTSGEMIKDTISVSHLSGFKKANSMLRSNMDGIDNFIKNNPKGKKLLQYYLALEDMLSDEHDTLDQHSDRLMLKIKAIRDVIFAQQSYASGGKFSEELQLSDVVEDTLKLQEGAIARHNMHIVKDFQEVPHFFLQRTRLMQIMMNLFKNAKEAMGEANPDRKVLTISIYRDEENAYIKVADTGCGIHEDNLKRIFNHGFTTKRNGHGFGLHSCANYMAQMGGTIRAESDGENKGATFVLKFPIEEKDPNKPIKRDE